MGTEHDPGADDPQVTRRTFLWTLGAASLVTWLGTPDTIAEAAPTFISIPLTGIHPGIPGLTPDRQFLVVPNQDTDNVSIVNLAALSVTGTVTLRPQSGPWMAVATPDSQFALVTNAMFEGPSLPSTVSVIDLATFTVTDEIPVGIGPNGIELDASGSRAYVANLRSDTVSVIDIASRQTIATIPVGSGPFFPKLSPNGDLLAVTNFRDATLSVIDVATLAVVRTIQVGIPGLTEPNPEFGPGDTCMVDITPEGVAFVANWRSSEIVLIDLASGSVLQRLTPAANPFDVHIDPSPKRRLVTIATYSTDTVKRLVALDLDTFSVITDIPTDGTAFPTGRAALANYWLNDPILSAPSGHSNHINGILPKGIKGIPVLFADIARHL